MTGFKSKREAAQAGSVTKDKALKLALEALEWINRVNAMDYEYQQKAREALNAIKEALAQPEQEPVAYPDGDVVGPCICGSWPGGKCFKCPRITTPPQRPWVGLTDEEIAQGCKESWVTEQAWQSAVWWAEAKLKDLNT